MTPPTSRSFRTCMTGRQKDRQFLHTLYKPSEMLMNLFLISWRWKEKGNKMSLWLIVPFIQRSACGCVRVCVCRCSHVTGQGNSFISIITTLLRQFVATESMKLTGPISRISTWGIAFNCIEEEEVAVLPSCGSSFRPQVTAWVLKAKMTRG